MIMPQVTLSGAQPILQRLEIRPLKAEDEPAYFALRRRVKGIGDGHYFSDSYTREDELITEQKRRDWCTETHEHCIMGAFINGRLSGIVMITQFGPVKDSAVEWEATWVDPLYRRTGLTKMLYEKVQQWTIDEEYDFVKVFIREDNTRWLDIRQRQGFTQVGTKHNELWADGTYGNTHAFVLDLRPIAADMRQQHALRYLEHGLEAIQNGVGVPLLASRHPLGSSPDFPISSKAPLAAYKIG